MSISDVQKVLSALNELGQANIDGRDLTFSIDVMKFETLDDGVKSTYLLLNERGSVVLDVKQNEIRAEIIINRGDDTKKTDFKIHGMIHHIKQTPSPSNGHINTYMHILLK